VSPAAAPAAAVTASAPGRLELSGAEGGPWLSIAVDRRALCRVEGSSGGVLVESKDALTRVAAADVDELVARSPGSLAAQALAVCGAPGRLRVVTEWKLPAGSGVDASGALSLAAVAALKRALGRDLPPEELVTLASEAARRADGAPSHGVHVALWGGVLRTRQAGSRLEAERLGVDPGRIEECLMLVDTGAAEAAPPALASGATASLTDAIADALRSGRYEDVVELLAREAEGAPASAGQRAVLAVVRSAGGAARPLAGRLVAVWAPPGARGPGRRESVAAALKEAGLKPLPIRIDLRGLEVE
jgi:GHMP kinases N terminal domain